VVAEVVAEAEAERKILQISRTSIRRPHLDFRFYLTTRNGAEIIISALFLSGNESFSE